MPDARRRRSGKNGLTAGGIIRGLDGFGFLRLPRHRLCARLPDCNSVSSISASFMRCLCKPRLIDVLPWTCTEMRMSDPAFA